MSSKTERYEVQLRAGFPSNRRVRAGFIFVPGQPQVLELTKDQVEAIKNDPELKIKKTQDDVSGEAATADKPGNLPTPSRVKPADEGASAPDPTLPEGDGGEATGTEGDEAGSEEGEGSQEGSDQEPVTSPEGQVDPAAPAATEGDTAPAATAPVLPTVDQLLKDNNRDALVAQAKEAKIELAYDDSQNVTKKVIAEAIVAARG